MTRRIGVGLIATGWMGQVHSRAYRSMPSRFPEYDIEPRLVICADNVEARAKGVQTRFGFEKITTDWREVLENPDVEVVNITAPNNKHLEFIQAAVAAGKHVFCEKPVGRSPEEAAAAEEATRKAGVLSFTGFCYRWAPLVQWLGGLISDGRLGDITHYRGRFLVGYATNPNGVLSWRFDRDIAGTGSLGDLMSHVVDMAHFLVGPMERVVSQSDTYIKERPLATPGEGTHFSVSTGGPRAPVTNEDYVGALTRFVDGANGTLEVCRVVAGEKCQMAFELNGTKGAARWNFEKMNEIEVYLPEETEVHDGYARIYSGPEHPLHGRFTPGPALGLGYEDLATIEVSQFLKCVADGEQIEPSFRAVRDVAEVHAAMTRSWSSGSWENVRPIDL